MTSAPPQTRPPRSRRPRPFEATVVAVEQPSSHLRRVTLGGDGLADFHWPGPGSHLKLFLPEPGQRHVDLPSPAQWGEPGLPPMTTRTFTPRAWDEATGQLQIELVLHGHGPASQWAADVRAGDSVAVSQPRRRYDIHDNTTWVLLAGDETAIPAVATILEALAPAVSAHALVEVEPGHEHPPLPERDGTIIEWVDSEPGAAPGTALRVAVADALSGQYGGSRPVEHGQAWVGCEASAVRAIRRHLLEEVGLARDRVVTRGYWRLGSANHPDHDNGDEPLTAPGPAAPLSLGDLVKNGSVRPEGAEILARIGRSGQSFLTYARPGGAGKSTLAEAILAEAPDTIRRHDFLGESDEAELLRSRAARGYLVVAEIGHRGRPGYLTDEQVTRAFDLVRDGWALASSLHADTVEEVTAVLARNGVDVDTAASLDWLVKVAPLGNPRVSETRRVVEEICAVTGAGDGQLATKVAYRRHE